MQEAVTILIWVSEFLNLRVIQLEIKMDQSSVFYAVNFLTKRKQWLVHITIVNCSVYGIVTD